MNERTNRRIMDKQKKSDGFLAASHCIALKEKGATGER